MFESEIGEEGMVREKTHGKQLWLYKYYRETSCVSWHGMRLALCMCVIQCWCLWLILRVCVREGERESGTETTKEFKDKGRLMTFLRSLERDDKNLT